MNSKIKLKFLIFFTICLAGFCIYIGVFMQILFDVVFSSLGLLHAEENIVYFMPVLLLSLISGGALFSLAFVQPQLTMISIINRLSAGDYDINSLLGKVYTKRGRLKPQYFLYSELINDFSGLSVRLEKSKNDRARLEEAKKEWIRGISHDLKTPLSYILGYSALLAKEDYNWDDEEKKKFLDEITSKGKYMEQLISDLKLSIDKDMDHGAIMPLYPEAVDLVPFLQNIIVDIANQPNAADYRFGFDFGSETIAINADKKLLYRAFQNLLTNALSHNPPGTEVSVSVASEEQFVTICFADTGTGIGADAVETLTGTGMLLNNGKGLAVIRNVVLSHKGSISVETATGQGTTITIKLTK